MHCEIVLNIDRSRVDPLSSLEKLQRPIFVPEDGIRYRQAHRHHQVFAVLGQHPVEDPDGVLVLLPDEELRPLIQIAEEVGHVLGIGGILPYGGLTLPGNISQARELPPGLLVEGAGRGFLVERGQQRIAANRL